MAKDTSNYSLADKEIAKQFGDGIITDAQSIIDHPREIVSVSPALDSVLGGGIQVGSFVIFAGQPRTGKTSTALNFAAHWQSLGRKVVFLNAESRLESRNVTCLPRPKDFKIIQHQPGQILTAQDFLRIALTYLNREQHCLIIIDSISVLSEEREMVGGIGTETRGGSAKLMAQFCRLATPVIPVNSHVVIGMAQLYSNTSGRGKDYYVSMGKKVDYALYTLLYATHSSGWTASGNEEDKNLIGQINHWRVERSPISPPGGKVDGYLRYKIGIDELKEYLKFAEDLSIIEKNGAYYYYPSKENALVKGHGAEQFYNGFIDNPQAYESLKKQVRGLLFDDAA